MKALSRLTKYSDAIVLFGLIFFGHGCICHKSNLRVENTHQDAVHCLCPNECSGEYADKCQRRYRPKYLTGGTRTPIEIGVPVHPDNIEKTIFLKANEKEWQVVDRVTAGNLMRILATASPNDVNMPKGAAEVYFDLPLGYLYFFLKGERDDFGVAIADGFIFHRDRVFDLNAVEWNGLCELLHITPTEEGFGCE